MSGSLDLTPLQKAVRRLAEGVAEYEANRDRTIVRDGLIQRFEFTYETAQKMLKRYLEATVASPDEIDRMAFADVIRSANERGLLLGAWKEWKGYRDMRGRTSHTYDEAIALEVVAGIPAFLTEAEHLFQRLQERDA